MRVPGWLARAMGRVGIFACDAASPLPWALSVGSTLRDVGWAVLVLASTGSIADRLGAIDARMQ